MCVLMRVIKWALKHKAADTDTDTSPDTPPENACELMCRRKRERERDIIRSKEICVQQILLLL